MKKLSLYCLAIFSLSMSFTRALAQTNTFPTSGSVGIGTLAPQRKLDVKGIIQSNSHVIVTNPANADASFQLGWRNNIPRIRLGGGGAGSQEGLDVQVIGDRSILRVLYNGNVGIGTANPISSGSYRILDITGSSPSTGGYIRLATSDASGEGRILATDDRLIFDVQKPGMSFQWRNSAGEEIYRLNPNGLARWLGSAGGYTEIGSNGNGQFIRQYSNNGTTQSWLIRGYASQGVQAVFSSGGINVNGTVRSKEVKVTLDGWADYVFEKDYKLMPLKEVKAYIQTNKHLPGIPTKAEVQKEGLNLGEMNAKLLEKIEELTLYIIEQGKQMEQLQEAIATKDLQYSEIERRLSILENQPKPN